ncbi:phosphate signaling complex protein PhoU [Leucobacter sp. OH2974_COT-288]|uniref:Phosphate-specific transport system accessory protein PhoU n=1 Tax=Canibacter oris TaxID=1365628 RepID=A0A840DF01_9MICO|nr:phosphate signaling complex protein PhoU [Canibacter oris]MBB4071260.1 phosphate transport system protein [Canibacter oris]RRD36655.1 phosphate signaling complex protein PhoU [Leucobacter sp. OH2974_COT-288]
MRQVFQQELIEIQEGLVELAQLMVRAIENATEAFAGSDIVLAEKVIEHDPEVDRLAASLDERVTKVLALQQPVATDLRLMVSALRMSASLERMADLAQHIAQLARLRYPENAIPEPLRKTFTRMGKLDIQMAHKIVELLEEQNIDTIVEIRDLDDELDELHTKVFEKVLTAGLMEKPEHAVDATLASRYHERFGDHAVSISKQMHYFLAGQRLS